METKEQTVVFFDNVFKKYFYKDKSPRTAYKYLDFVLSISHSEAMQDFFCMLTIIPTMDRISCPSIDKVINENNPYDIIYSSKEYNNYQENLLINKILLPSYERLKDSLNQIISSEHIVLVTENNKSDISRKVLVIRLNYEKRIIKINGIQNIVKAINHLVDSEVLTELQSKEFLKQIPYFDEILNGTIQPIISRNKETVKLSEKQKLPPQNGNYAFNLLSPFKDDFPSINIFNSSDSNCVIS